ncbi:MAG: right-handed parallel beta-helix repeat-containing protein, partial [Verrucomicrobiota bacterium]
MFGSKLTGTSTAPIIVRQYPGERATLDSTGLQGSTISLTGSYTWYWGFEVASSSTARTSTQTGPWPTDVNCNPSIATPNAGTGNKFINLVVHDNPLGFGLWSANTDLETYGCLVYYNGWNAPDRGHGHGIYAQNLTGYKKILDNIIFYNTDHGMQAYGSAAAGVNNFTVDGNIFYENSRLFTAYTSGRNLLIGGDAVAQNPLVRNNCIYRAVAGSAGGTSDFYLGYTSGASGAVMQNNYIVCTALFASNLTGMTMDSNYLCGTVSGLNTATYPNNTFTTTRPTTGTKVVVRPNTYEPGRANIAIYNWSLANTVTVDLTGAGLNAGDTYELHNTMNYFGDVITGTYAGGTITVPMTGRTVAAPSGLPAPASPFPQFGAFVLLKTGSGTPPNTAPTITSIANQIITA